MTIPESQLDTWSKQGSVAQSRSTYEIIRHALQDKSGPYLERSCSIFLQGSYGNDTNIYSDSDVDINITTNSIFYEDLSNLSAIELAAYRANHYAGGYSYDEFKRDVLLRLYTAFPNAIHLGNKAIAIDAQGSRRKADVVPAVQYRRYNSYSSDVNQSYVEGIVLWTPNGTEIVNYPKQHLSNCTKKHQETRLLFKPLIRIFKNLRNRMIENGYLNDEVAPSYFIEGMLYNVPSWNFSFSYQETIINSLRWLVDADRSALVCANEQYFLLHPTSPVTWRIESYDAFLNAVIDFWADW